MAEPKQGTLFEGQPLSDLEQARVWGEFFRHVADEHLNDRPPLQVTLIENPVPGQKFSLTPDPHSL